MGTHTHCTNFIQPILQIDDEIDIEAGLNHDKGTAEHGTTLPHSRAKYAQGFKNVSAHEHIRSRSSARCYMSPLSDCAHQISFFRFSQGQNAKENVEYEYVK